MCACSPPRAGSGSDTSVITVAGVSGRSPPKTSAGSGIVGKEGKTVGSERLNSDSDGIGNGLTVGAEDVSNNRVPATGHPLKGGEGR